MNSPRNIFIKASQLYYGPNDIEVAWENFKNRFINNKIHK
jgi:hypothetical protein